MMKLSISGACVTSRLGLDEGFAAIKAAGFDLLDQGLDFLTWKQATFPENDAVPFFSDEKAIEEYVATMTAAAARHGLTFGQFHAPFPPYNPACELAGENMRFVTKKSIEITAACGCDKIVIHPCLDWDLKRNALTPKEEWDLNIAFYSSLIPTLKANHVTCCLENMILFDPHKKPVGSVCTQAYMANRYVNTLNEIAGERLFGICLDIGHLYLAGVDIENTILELGENLLALHIHDNDGRDDQHNAPYIGGFLPWDRFLRGLKSIDYRGSLNFESGNAIGCFPTPLVIPALNLLGETAKYFRDEILKS